jgi:uncharacterized membrane protein YcaP (DUF421 family)
VATRAPRRHLSSAGRRQVLPPPGQASQLSNLRTAIAATLAATATTAQVEVRVSVPFLLSWAVATILVVIFIIVVCILSRSQRQVPWAAAVGPIARQLRGQQGCCRPVKVRLGDAGF